MLNYPKINYMFYALSRPLVSPLYLIFTTLIDAISWTAIENETIVKSISLTKCTLRVRYFSRSVLVRGTFKKTWGRKHITNDLAVMKSLDYLVVTFQSTFLIIFFQFISHASWILAVCFLMGCVVWYRWLWYRCLFLLSLLVENHCSSHATFFWILQRLASLWNCVWLLFLHL